MAKELSPEVIARAKVCSEELEVLLKSHKFALSVEYKVNENGVGIVATPILVPAVEEVVPEVVKE